MVSRLLAHEQNAIGGALVQERTIIVDLSDGVATVSLARPEKRNALNLQMKAELASTIDRLSTDRNIGAVVITGQGSAFCAGADLGDLAAESGAEYREYLRGLQRDLIERIVQSPVCFVAAVNGPAVGGGLSLALACDIIVAGRRASFGAPFPSLGLAPDLGATFHLARSLGLHRARAMLLLGQSLGADEAYRVGLAHEVCGEDDVVARAQELASRVAGWSRWAVDATKRLTLAGAELALDDVLEQEATTQALLRLSDEHKAAVARFLEERDSTATPPPGLT